MKHSLKRLTSACLAMLMLLQLFPAALWRRTMTRFKIAILSVM